MLKNYLKIAWRNIVWNKTFSLLNIGGLALGMAACIIMLVFVFNERSFDAFHRKSDRIFRLTEVQTFNAMPEQKVAFSMYPMGPALKQEYPAISTYTRIYHQGEKTLRNGTKQINVPQFLAADSSFFELFDFSADRGNILSSLYDPTSIVLTKKTALNLFGDVDVVGKTVSVYEDDAFKDFKVTAVLNDIPDNSHLQFDALVSFASVPKEEWMLVWDANWVNTYLLLNENASVEDLRNSLPAFEAKYLKEQDKNYALGLQPLKDIHLGSEGITHDYLNHKKFSNANVKIFLLLSIFVLLIAVFNFINLSTARALKRAKEVGVRKTVGASKWELIKQFIGEAVLLTFFSILVSIVLVKLGMPLINRIIDRDLQFNLFSDPLNLLVLLAVTLIAGLLSGIYPAFVISSYQPVKVLKGNPVAQINKKFSFRTVLVVTQFVIAIALITSTLLAVKQLNYIRNKELGFDKEQVINIKMNATANKNFEFLKSELLKNPNIANITASNRKLGSNIGQMGAKYLSDRGEEKHITASHLIVDYNYLPFYGIQLKEGRNFSREFAKDKRFAYIINEALAKELELKTPIGSKYRAAWEKEMGTIIGVVKDFNFNTLHEKVAPMYISIQEWPFHQLSVKLKPGNVQATLAFLEKEWNETVTDMPFSYTFLDEHLQGLYKTDQQVSTVVKIATTLSIIIACLGLFGIALYSIQVRKKEIGIRKVLGADVGKIASLLSVNFLRPVAIAIVIAAPISWYYMSRWLEDFAYRINIEWWMFLVAGIIALFIAFFTISFQAIKAAMANPVKNLRTE